MGLHRFYWVPRGFEAGRGAYVRYPAEELYAVHCLESHRGKAVLVGEDLGTVPPSVRPAMEKHNIHRLFVSQYELKPWKDAAVTPPYPGSVAGLNTHDMPPFSAFWRGLDIEDRVQMGLMDETAATWEAEQRAKVREAVIQTLRQAGRLGDDDDEPLVLRACLEQLAAGEPLAVMVNIEDLWQETEPQNRPGTTWDKMPNWQVRAAHPVEEFDSLPGLRDTLEALNRVVRGDESGLN
jgi:4-alpha-glucanotransferase